MNIQEYIESGIIESYVLGLTEPKEALEVEEMSRQYSEVHAAIDEFSLAVETNAFNNAVEPPAFVKENVMAHIRGEATTTNAATAATKPLTVSYSNDGEAPALNKKPAMWQYLAAALIILFVLSCAGNIYLYNKYSHTNQQYVALLNERNSLQASNQIYQTRLNDYKTATQLMADPGVEMVKMSDPAHVKDAMTTVFWDTRTRDVYLMANKLPEPGANQQYQLWALVDGKPVDAGMLDPNCTSLCKMKNIPKAQAFAITLEKTGGSPVPTMEQLYVLGKI